MSQDTNINPRNKTVTLDEEQLTEVDKGLRNEKRQRERIAQLEDALLEKDEKISALAKENKQLFDDIVNLSNKISEDSERVYELTETLYENEKKKSNNGFYLGIDYATDPVNTAFGKISWVSSRTIFSAGLSSVNIENERNIVYNFGFYLKIF